MQRHKSECLLSLTRQWITAEDVCFKKKGKKKLWQRLCPDSLHSKVECLTQMEPNDRTCCTVLVACQDSGLSALTEPRRTPLGSHANDFVSHNG